MEYPSLWKVLKNLVEKDRIVRSLDQDLSRVNADIGQEQRAFQQFTHNLKSHEEKLIQAKKLVHSLELKASSLQEQEQEKKKQLEAVKHQKEFNALTHELEKLAEEDEQTETALLKAWHELDHCEAIYKKLKGEQTQLAATQTAFMETYEKKRAQLQESKQQALLQRDAAAALIPPVWLTHYTRMKDSVINPIVPLLDTTCSSCYYIVLRQDLAALKQGGLISCKNCFRLLYYDTTPPASET